MIQPLSLRELLAAPPLSADREQALARAARAGSRGARTELIQASLRLVALRVRHLRIAVGGVDDALQAGAVGLISAVDRFDPDRGVRLATYAWPWITAGIRSVPPARSVVGMDVPPPASGLCGDLDDVVARLPSRLAVVVRLRFRLGEPPDALRTHANIAARLGLSVGQVRRAEAQALGQLRDRLATLGDRDPL
ncbi:MAG TPA: sigma factor [Aeromicrobium sp.]|nr:sigma factor [Aeromicrobium sp.]